MEKECELMKDIQANHTHNENEQYVCFNKKLLVCLFFITIYYENTSIYIASEKRRWKF